MSLLLNLHWLPVGQRVIFKTAVLVWKRNHGVASVYLQELCTQVDKTLDLLTHSLTYLLTYLTTRLPSHPVYEVWSLNRNPAQPPPNENPGYGWYSQRLVAVGIRFLAPFGIIMMHQELAITTLSDFYRAMLCIRGTSHGPVSIGVTSYGALGHVPPLELGHVKKIWQFLR